MYTLDEKIGVLKLDIEGAEVDLLEALLASPIILSRIRHIFAETHEKRILDHRMRVKAIRKRARKVKQPDINLNRHRPDVEDTQKVSPYHSRNE